MLTLFISDLHLDKCRPEITACFLNFLSGQAQKADSLYILGDLFEAWVGDDATDEHQRQVMQALRRYTDGGHACYFIRGNRDLLAGSGFAAETGVRMLSEPATVSVEGQTAILVHGDHLCTDDRAYQHFRTITQNRWVQRLFLSLPARLRHRFARWLRVRSAWHTARKSPEITDVSQAAVEALLRHYQARLLIHGHTHRPAIHDFELDGAPARRIVLGDWYTQGSVLQWRNGTPELLELNCPG